MFCGCKDMKKITTIAKNRFIFYSRTELVCEKYGVTYFSSSGEEEYPQGEVVAIHSVLFFIALCSLPPRPLGTPPPRRRGIKILALFAFLFANHFCSTIIHTYLIYRCNTHYIHLFLVLYIYTSAFILTSKIKFYYEIKYRFTF